MSTQFDPRDYPLALETPRRLTDMGFWHMHIPFAFALMQMLRPKVYVELGAHKGDSYCAVCQAVETLDLGTRCYAVDTWAGDIHTGEYDDTVINDLRAHHDPLYGEFSTLIRSLFDDAVEEFDDGSIDLLHIDGTHTYEEARHDFETWLPKMSSQGVVIMHDIAEYRQDFGVWRFWDELKERYPHFEFLFGHGLGVVAVGETVPEGMQAFFDDKEHVAATAHYFSILGERVEALGKERLSGAESGAEDVAAASLVEVPDDLLQSPEAAPRLIAFYLPQYHPVPENNVWWGNGFTEWTNVAQARPLFPGHDQPRLPADLGFYDLRLPEVREAQADLAREHGIYGFCYYHYWFKGRRILERPLNEVLASGRPDFPFCLCWANENWTRNWDARERERLIAQEYSEEDDREHIRWLLNVFQDERYIKIGGRPLLLIYRVQAMPDPARTMTMWKEEAQRMGVAEPYICRFESHRNYDDPREFGCDAAAEFLPHGLDRLGVKPVQKSGEELGDNIIYEYEDLIAKHLDQEKPSYQRFPCVVTSWDNTPRHKAGGATILRGSTPELYENWLKGVIGKTSSNSLEERIVFINAWNEWAEGAYLEPDLRHGRGYLEATKRALRSNGAEVPVEVGTNGRQSGKVGEGSPNQLSIEEQYRDLLNKYVVMQQRFTEQLGTTDHHPLVRELEERYTELERHYKKIQEHHKEVVRHFRDDRAESKKQLQELRKKARDMDRLVAWMEQLDTGVSAMLNSRQWQLAHAIGEIYRKALRNPQAPQAWNRVNSVLKKFRAWRNRSRQEKSRPNESQKDELSSESTRPEKIDGNPAW